MYFNRVRDTRDKDFTEIWKIYKNSFSLDLRRTLKSQREVFNNKSYFFLSAYDKDQLVGFIILWNLKDFIFIEYLLIKERLRCKGYGTKIVKRILNKYHGRCVVEVGKPNDETIRKKIKFYQRLNFKVNNYKYIQPPYGPNKNPVPLLIMSYPDKIIKNDFKKIKEKIYKTIYNVT